MEHSILTTNAADMAKRFASPFSKVPANGDLDGENATLATSINMPINVVELGAGDGRKTKILLRAMLSTGVDFQYFPVDISARAMENLSHSLSKYFSDQPLHIHGIIGDYISSLSYIYANYPSRHTVVLFLGASIGNFSRDEAESFFRQIKSNMMPRDYLLCGFDLKKDPEALRKAYSDSNGVTREFNLNLLTRFNRELGANFDITQFHHLAIYNPVRGSMESYLVSKRKQEAKIAGKRYHFELGEPIHTENSVKYSVKEVLALTENAGFTAVARYTDDFSEYDTKEPWFLEVLLCL